MPKSKLYVLKGMRLEGDSLRCTMEGTKLRKVGPAILDDIEAVTDNQTARYFASRYGFLRPFQTSGPAQEFADLGKLISALRTTIRSIMQNRMPARKVLARLKQAAPGEFPGRAPSVLRRDIANFMAGRIAECKMRPAIDWWAEDGLWGIGWVQEEYKGKDPPPFLTCALAAIIVFLLDEMTGRTSEGEVPCAVCRHLFKPKRTQAGRRAFCDKCRGSRGQWRLYKRPEGAEY